MSCPCEPGPIQSTITWAAYEAKLRDNLGEAACDLDAFTLETLLETATVTADRVVGCSLECDPSTEAVTVPNPVILGVFTFVKAMIGAIDSGDDIAGNVQAVKTGDLSVTYSAGGSDVEKAAIASAMIYWRSYICNPLR